MQGIYHKLFALLQPGSCTYAFRGSACLIASLRSDSQDIHGSKGKQNLSIDWELNQLELISGDVLRDSQNVFENFVGFIVSYIHPFGNPIFNEEVL